jgi:hypothetical protein
VGLNQSLNSAGFTDSFQIRMGLRRAGSPDETKAAIAGVIRPDVNAIVTILSRSLLLRPASRSSRDQVTTRTPPSPGSSGATMPTLTSIPKDSLLRSAGEELKRAAMEQKLPILVGDPELVNFPSVVAAVGGSAPIQAER